MKKQLINYETLLKVTKAMSMSTEPEEVVRLTVESVKTSLEIKGCALFLIDPKSKELEVAAASGLSSEYLNKGPISAIRSIGQSLKEGPVAIYDVTDDQNPVPESSQERKILGVAAMSMRHICSDVEGVHQLGLLSKVLLEKVVQIAKEYEKKTLEKGKSIPLEDLYGFPRLRMVAPGSELTGEPKA